MRFRLKSILHNGFGWLLASIPAFLIQVSPVSASATIEMLKDPQALPPVTLVDEEGKRQVPEAMGDKILVLHLWASWCVPCLEELPQLDAFAKKYKNKGVHVVPISLDKSENLDKVKEFYARHRVASLPIRFEETPMMRKVFSVKVLPATFLVVDGDVVARIDGAADWQGRTMEAFFSHYLSGSGRNPGAIPDN